MTFIHLLRLISMQFSTFRKLGAVMKKLVKSTNRLLNSFNPPCHLFYCAEISVRIKQSKIFRH